MNETTYLQMLEKERAIIQPALDALLKKYQVDSVGKGYIDIIVSPSKSFLLIEELTKLSICIESVSWWCHYIPKKPITLDCPHGGGGPGNKFGPGWFSECYHYPCFEVEKQGFRFNKTSISMDIMIGECNRIVRHYLETEWIKEKFYSSCLYPGLWLQVPDSWKKQSAC